MNQLEKKGFQDFDPTASERKKDHIELAFQSQVEKRELDNRFYYEPMLSAHPNEKSWGEFSFLNKEMQIPIWVSSMTGGTGFAKTINHNLARACKDFGMGMGLGSCRSLLFEDENLKDFDIRHLVGDDLPLYANLGLAQIEQLIENNDLGRVRVLLEKLSADGLIIHVNPLQEWLQPEGDHFKYSPIETISTFLEKMNVPVIIKEVGQGFGKESMRQLLQMPLQAIDFAANGGTNFAKLELLRSTGNKRNIYAQLANVGHSAEEMMNLCNELMYELGEKAICKQVIISGGIGSFLDGYYLINKIKMPAVYGQAAAFLKQARGDYETLYNYVKSQVKGLELAKAFLKVK